MEGHPQGVKIHRFYLSYKINGEVHTAWFQGVHIRFAKDKLLFQNPEATDIMDWTHEKSEDLKAYLTKQNAKKLTAKLRLKDQTA